MKSKSYFMYNFSQFDSFFLFDFNIAKMHIFCSFVFKKITVVSDKNNVYRQPIPKKLMHLRFWSNVADLRTEAQKVFNASTMHTT